MGTGNDNAVFKVTQFVNDLVYRTVSDTAGRSSGSRTCHFSREGTRWYQGTVY